MHVNKSKITISDFLAPVRENKLFVFSSLIILFGIFSSCIFVSHISNPFYDFIKKYILSFVEFRSSSGFFTVFFTSFLNYLTFIIFITVAGFGAGGLFVMPLLIFIRGFATGIVSGMLYREYSLVGIAFADLILLPVVLAFNFIVIYFSAKAMRLSLNFCSLIRDRSSRGIEIRQNCIALLNSCIKCMVVAIVISIVESLLSVGFIGFFDFK